MHTTAAIRTAERASAGRAFWRQAWWTWILFWLVAMPTAHLLGLNKIRLALLTLAAFLAIEGIDGLRRWAASRRAT